VTVVSSPLPRLADQVARVPTVAMPKVAVQVARAAERQAAKVAGGDRRLSNSGRGPLGVKTRVRAGTATVVAAPPGPWQWITSGTDPHLIWGRRRRGKRGRGVLVIGGRVVTGPAHHRGTRPRRAWNKVAADAADILPAVTAAELRRVVN